MSRARTFRVFPGLIFVFIGLNVCIVGITVYAAATDKSFAVEPDYYRKAVGWDRAATQARRSAALGWRASIEIGPVAGSVRPAVLRLRDREGRPIAGAAVELTAFASLDAARRVGRDMPETEPGVYAAAIPIAAGGVWECRVTARRNGEVFTATLSAEATGEKARGGVAP